MSAEHAGTRKWSKMIKSHSELAQTDNLNNKLNEHCDDVREGKINVQVDL